MDDVSACVLEDPAEIENVVLMESSILFQPVRLEKVEYLRNCNRSVYLWKFPVLVGWSVPLFQLVKPENVVKGKASALGQLVGVIYEL